MKNFKVGFVSTFTPESNYSQFLLEAINELKTGGDIKVMAYAPLNEDISNIKVLIKKKVWNSILYPLQIAFQSFRDRLDAIHFQYEFNMYGSIIFSSFFPLALLFQKLLGKRTITTIHVVVSQNEIDKNFRLTFNARFFPNMLIKMWFRINYFFIGYLSDTIIVHSKCFREILEKDYKVNKNKIIVLHVGVPIYSDTDKGIKLLRELIKNYKNEKIILSFGYITKRKGLDYLVKAFEKVSHDYKDVLLVIAGNTLPYEKKYVEELKKNASDKHNILILDRFLTLDEIKALYKNSYMSVFPYTYSISSSATTAFSFAFSVPLIVTNLGSFKDDIEETNCGILVGKRSVIDLEGAIKKLLEDKDAYKIIKTQMNIVKKQRSWDNIAKQTVILYRRNIE